MDRPTSTAATPSSPAPVAQPAPSQTPATPATGGVSPETTAKFADAFGAAPSPDFDQAADTATSDAPPTDGGHATAEATAGVSDAAQSQEQPGDTAATLPGDDILAELEKLTTLPGQEPQKPADDQQPPPTAGEHDDDQGPLTDDQFEKRINPDGNATPEQQLENARKLAKHAQSRIGQQGQELGQYRKAFQAIAPHFEFDADNGTPRLKPESLFQFADALPQEQVSQLLAQRGLKIVPVNQDSATASDNPDYDLQMQIASEMVEDADMTPEDKYATIMSDPKQQARLLGEFTRRQSANKEKAAKEQAALLAQSNEEKQFIDSSFAALAKLPYWESDLKPAMQKLNDWLGEKPLTGRRRFEVVHKLAQFARTTKVVKEVRDKAYRAGYEAALQAQGMGMPSGEVPIYTPGSAPARASANGPGARAQQFASAFL